MSNNLLGCPPHLSGAEVGVRLQSQEVLEVIPRISLTQDL